MNFMIIKRKKGMIYGENVHKHTNYKNLKMSKHNLWVECEKHKRFVKLLNDKLLKNQEVKNQPQDVVILHEKIRTLKTTLAKFVNGIDNLNKLLGYCRSSSKNMEIDMIGRYMFMIRTPLFAIYVARLVI